MASIQLSIADPCHENWNNMLPEEKGRFCLSCQKTVIDFTSMTDGQVFDYFKNYKGNTCGQFTPEQLNRNIAKPATHSIGRWKYFWQILLPAVFTFYKSEAQKLKGEMPPKIVCKVDTTHPTQLMLGKVSMPSAEYKAPGYQLQGIVMNEKKEPIPYATIAGEGGKTIAADSNGHFSMEMLPGKRLTISSVGYETKLVSFDSVLPEAIKAIKIDKRTNTVLISALIELQPVQTNAQDVIVVGGYARIRRSTGGAVSCITKSTVFSREIKPTEEINQLKIFPNPIQPGQPFQINLQVKKAGNYLLRIADASGKMMMEEKLTITAKNQTETISGNALQNAGIYFVEIYSPADKREKKLSGRIVVR